MRSLKKRGLYTLLDKPAVFLYDPFMLKLLVDEEKAGRGFLDAPDPYGKDGRAVEGTRFRIWRGTGYPPPSGGSNPPPSATNQNPSQLAINRLGV